MEAASTLHVPRVPIVFAAMMTAIVLAACRSIPPIREGQQFSASGVQFRVPAGTDWFKYQDDPDGIYLERFGPGPGEVLSVGMHFDFAPPMSSPDAFLEFARESLIGKLLWKSRQVDLQLRTDRGYTCVLAHVTGDVYRHESIFGIFGTAHLRHANAFSLFCQYPGAPNKTFAAVYHHIGDGLPQGFEESAAAFIDSVRPVTPDPAPPQRP